MKDVGDFETFAVERGPVLIRLAYALCADLGLAEDLVQDVLIKVNRDWARISVLDAPNSYVRRMLTNEFLSWRRKWGRIVPVAEVTLSSHGDHADAHAERDLLRAEVSRLPRRQQVVLALRYYGGLSDPEIADAWAAGRAPRAPAPPVPLATLRIEPTFADRNSSIRAQKGSPL